MQQERDPSQKIYIEWSHNVSNWYSIAPCIFSLSPHAFRIALCVVRYFGCLFPQIEENKNTNMLSWIENVLPIKSNQSRNMIKPLQDWNKTPTNCQNKYIHKKSNEHIKIWSKILIKFAFGIMFVFSKHEIVLCRGICCMIAWNIKTKYVFV